MKKTLLILVATGSILFAQNAEQQKTMQEMEVSLAVIQRGFLYNDPLLVKGGVKSLQEQVAHIEPPSKSDEEVFGRGNTYSYKYAAKQKDKIISLTNALIENYDKGEKYAAMSKYKDTLKQCLACHRKIRRW